MPRLTGLFFRRLIACLTIVSQILSPLYYAGLLNWGPVRASDVEAVTPAVTNLAALPPLTLADVLPPQAPDLLPVAAPVSADPTFTPQEGAATRLIEQGITNSRPQVATKIEWTAPSLALGNADGKSAHLYYLADGGDFTFNFGCMTVAFGGTYTTYRNSLLAVRVKRNPKLGVYLNISDQVLGCNDPGWVKPANVSGISSVGADGYQTLGFYMPAGLKIRSVRFMATNGGNVWWYDPNHATSLDLDHFILRGNFTPDGTEGEAGCGDVCTGANTLLQAQGPTVGQPIQPRTGNYVYGNTDLSLQGQNRTLAFRRIYSVARIPYADAMLGPGWTHNYNLRLIFSGDAEGVPGEVIFQESNGSRQYFRDDGNGSYVPNAGLLANLSRSGTENNYIYTMVLPDQTRYRFDNSGRLTQIDRNSTAENWPPLVLTYDTNGRLVRVTDGQTPNERYLEFAYDTNGHLIHVYDHRRAGDPNSPQVTFNYNSNGELEWAQDVRGQRWSYEYQPGTHRLTRILNPLQQVVEEQSYDTAGRVTEQRREGGEVIVKLTYNTDGTVTVKDAQDNATTYIYNKQGAFAGMRLTVDGNPVTTGVMYDPNYRPFAQQDANGQIAQLTWSSDGQRLASIQGAGQSQATQLTYDTTPGNEVYNRLIQITDARGNPTQFEYQNTAFPTLPTATINAQGQRTEYTYTAHGQLETVRDAQGVVTRYEYDSWGQRTKAIQNYVDGNYDSNHPQEDVPTIFAYDPVGHLTTTTRVDGRVDQIVYDAAGNVERTVLNYVDGNYNPAEPDTDVTISMIYDLIGRLTTVTDTLGRQTAYVYDSANRLKREVQNFVGTDPDLVSYDPQFLDRNRLTEYTYSAAGDLLRVKDTVGRITAYVYDNNHRLVREVRNFSGSEAATVSFDAQQPDQNIITSYGYDAAGNRIRITDTFGRVDRICYDAMNRPTRRIQNVMASGDPCNPAAFTPADQADKDIVNTTVYDDNGNITDVYNAAGVPTHFVYDSLNRQVARIVNYQDGEHIFDPSSPNYDPPDRDVITKTYYDARGNVQFTVGPDWDVTWMCYDQLQRVVKTVVNPSSINPNDPNTLNISETNPAYPCHNDYEFSSASDKDIVTTTQYNSLGQVAATVELLAQTATGRVEHKTVYEYDRLGREIRRIENYQDGTPDAQYPDQDVIYRTQYNGLGQVVQTIDPLGRRTQLSYDALGRQVGTIRNYSDGAFDPSEPEVDVITTSAFDGVGRLLRQADPNSQTTVFAYDNLDRLTQVTDPLNHTIQTVYDGLGNVLQTQDAVSSTRFSYDQLNRQILTLASPAAGVNLTTGTEYDKLGRLLVQTDANHIQTRHQYDMLGRLTLVTENFDFATINTPNNPSTPDKNLQTQYAYDIVGNLLNLTLPTGSQIQYQYDALSRRTLVDGPRTDISDQWTTTYDKAGRVIATSDPNQQSQTLSYDGLGQLQTIDYSVPTMTDVQFSYDAAGRRTQMTDGLGTTTFVYDTLDRIHQVNDPLSQTITYSYDPAGRRTGMQMLGLNETTPRSIEYVYDQANRLTTVKDWDAATSDVSYQYDDANRMTGMTLPNGVLVTLEYDQANRLTKVRYHQDNVTLMQYDYTLDNVGNRVAVTEMIPVETTTLPAPTLVSPANTTATTNTLPTFDWNAIPNATATTEYEIQVDNDASFATALEFTTTGTATEQTPTVALVDGTYNWRVRALDAGIEGTWSAVWQVTVDTTPPDAPTLSEPLDQATTMLVKPTLKWTAVTSAVAYEVQISTAAEFTTLVIDPATTVTTTSYALPSALQQGEYYWQVRAKDALGNWSNYSALRQFRVNLQKTPADGSVSVTQKPPFTWALVTGATYEVQVASDRAFSNPEFTAAGTCSTSTGNCTATPATNLNFGTHYWRVRLNLGSGLVTAPFVWSLIVSPALPAAPVLSLPANAASVNTSTPTFTWAATTSTVGAPFTYELQVDNNSDFSSPEFDGKMAFLTLGTYITTGVYGADAPNIITLW
ncbi:MAG TPA: DUF6531 domain-containing protein [Phototrophicaceae bacterium]|nr:DUF6531 domain-containing protein [Phototrophicaceae bacterium]